MNNKNPLTVILSLLAWLVFGAISCWATTESLYHTELFGHGVHKIMYWAVVVGFYVITSLGTKWIIDSLNTVAYVENRRLKLIGGILIVAVFWIIVSLPTNAHTFLYKRAAKSVAQKELKWQEGQLASIADTIGYIATIRPEIMKPSLEIQVLKEQLAGEILNPDRPGFAKEAEEILQKIEGKLKVPIGTIPRTKAANQSKKELNRLREHYSNAIDAQLKIFNVNLEKDITDQLLSYKKIASEAKATEKRTHAMYEALAADDENREEVLTAARTEINRAYDVLDISRPDVAMSSRETYIDTRKGMPSNRLTNVVEVVYKDYLSGQLNKKYDMPETKGLIYFFLLSLMIDIAAFLFFNIALKN